MNSIIKCLWLIFLHYLYQVWNYALELHHNITRIHEDKKKCKNILMKSMSWRLNKPPNEACRQQDAIWDSIPGISGYLYSVSYWTTTCTPLIFKSQ